MYKLWRMIMVLSDMRGITHSGCSSSKTDHTEVIYVKLSVVEVKPRGSKHHCGQGGHFEESTSHQRFQGRTKIYIPS